MHNTYICREKIHVWYIYKNTFINDMMQNYIDILRQLNYELVKELGLFKHRAGLSFSQRHILYHIKNNISLSIQELADFLHVEHSTMSRNIKRTNGGKWSPSRQQGSPGLQKQQIRLMKRYPKYWRYWMTRKLKS